MAKNVFKPNEFITVAEKVEIEPYHTLVAEEIEEVESVPGEYDGPTADDLRREAELFKQSWEIEKEKLIAKSQHEAERIIKDAEAVAFDEIRKKTNQAQKIKQEAEDAAKLLLDEARQQAAELERAARSKVDEIEQKAYQSGYQEGKTQGYNEGKTEVSRLIERLHVIMAKAIEKRTQIIEESETELINLVLLIARKVIKVISENQKNVVINNVVQALRKLKTRSDVVIRVNLTDLQITTDHIKDFMQMVENIKGITVMEDATIERGGCIIETDFGHIDAKISSQMHEIEEKIQDLVPIKARKGEA